MDTYKKMRAIAKELKAIGLDDAISAADLIANENKESLSEKNKVELEFINNISSLNDISPLIISKVVIDDIDVIKTHSLLSELYAEYDLKEYYNKHEDLFIVNPDTVQDCIEYFNSIGIGKENILKILPSAVILGIEEVKERTTIVLSKFDVEFLVLLVAERMLYNNSFYTATKEALELIFTTLSTEKVKQLLIENPTFLWDFKTDDYKDDYAYKERHQEALATIEKYK